MIREHAILSLSGAHIWLKCAPSARFQEQILETESLYAEEGTLAHAMAAVLLDCWTNGWTATLLTERFSFAYVKAFNWYVAHPDHAPGQSAQDLTDAMVEHATTFAQYVYAIGGVILVEERLDLSKFIPLSWGTGDGINLHPDVIYISDFKYGAGQRVYAENNPQLMGYALGALLRAHALGYNPHTVVMSIVQPRMGEPLSAQISVDQLLDWATNTVAPQAALAIAGHGAFVAGDHCQWCKAKLSCAAYFKQFEDTHALQDPRVMTPEQRAFVLLNGDALTKWIKAVRVDAVKRMQARERIPGFKLVAGSSDRKFTDEAAVAAVLYDMGYTDDDIYTTSLKGITALESLLKPSRFKEVLGAYIYKPEGNPKLVPESHAAPAKCATAGDAYDNVIDQTQIN